MAGRHLLLVVLGVPRAGGGSARVVEPAIWIVRLLQPVGRRRLLAGRRGPTSGGRLRGTQSRLAGRKPEDGRPEVGRQLSRRLLALAGPGQLCQVATASRNRCLVELRPGGPSGGGRADAGNEKERCQVPIALLGLEPDAPVEVDHDDDGNIEGKDGGHEGQVGVGFDELDLALVGALDGPALVVGVGEAGWRLRGRVRD